LDSIGIRFWLPKTLGVCMRLEKSSKKRASS
jgi:hypothetical protein